MRLIWWLGSVLLLHRGDPMWIGSYYLSWLIIIPDNHSLLLTAHFNPCWCCMKHNRKRECYNNALNVWGTNGGRLIRGFSSVSVQLFSASFLFPTCQSNIMGGTLTCHQLLFFMLHSMVFISLVLLSWHLSAWKYNDNNKLYPYSTFKNRFHKF